MNWLLLANAAHLYAIAVWAGGSLVCTWSAYWAINDNPNPSQSFLQAIYKTVRWVVTPAMVLAWIAGLAMLLPAWSEFYSKMPWMHIKITIVLVLAGLTGVLSAKLKKAARGSNQKPVVFRALASAISILIAAIISLIVFRPGT